MAVLKDILDRLEAVLNLDGPGLSPEAWAAIFGSIIGSLIGGCISWFVAERGHTKVLLRDQVARVDQEKAQILSSFYVIQDIGDLLYTIWKDLDEVQKRISTKSPRYSLVFKPKPVETSSGLELLGQQQIATLFKHGGADICHEAKVLRRRANALWHAMNAAPQKSQELVSKINKEDIRPRGIFYTDPKQLEPYEFQMSELDSLCWQMMRAAYYDLIAFEKLYDKIVEFNDAFQNH